MKTEKKRSVASPPKKVDKLPTIEVCELLNGKKEGSTAQSYALKKKIPP